MSARLGLYLCGITAAACTCVLFDALLWLAKRESFLLP